MAKVTMNLQDSFLNQARKDGAEVKMLLLDGSNLTGTIRGFDNFTVILGARGGQHLIYKHAIAQISHTRSTSRREGGGGQDRRPGAKPREREEPKRPKPDAFNTLNLSQVKIPEEAETGPG